MINSFTNLHFYKKLEISLPKSNVQERKILATSIIEHKLDLKEFAGLLREDKKIALRFLWLMTEVGILDSNYLYRELPYFFKLCLRLDKCYQTSFAAFWLIAGVPVEDEATAMGLLFEWLVSKETNVTTKSRSILVLLRLADKYPELKNELIISLEDQADKHSADFKKRLNKVLLKLKHGQYTYCDFMGP